MSGSRKTRTFEPRSIDRAGRLTLRGKELVGVRAEIALPDRDEGQIRAVFRWPYDASGPKTGPARFRFETGVDTSPERNWSDELVELDEVHVYTSSPVHLSTSVEEIRAEADVMQMTITRKRLIEELAGKRTSISVIVTPNRLLNPWRSEELSYRGTVKMHPGQRRIVTDPALGKVTFEHLYEWNSSEDDALRQSRRYLIADFETDVPVEDKQGLRALLPLVDDLLLLWGFVTRTPMRAAGWIARGSTGHSEHYRRDMRLPDGRQRYRTIVNGGLTEPDRLQPFVRAAIKQFRKSPFQIQLRNALWALENIPDETLERKFVSLFSAFEGLMDALIAEPARKKSAADKKKRDQLRDRLLAGLAVAIKELDAPEHLHIQFTGAIRNVQALSFAERYRLLRKTRKVELDDIWPITATGDTMSLYRIRNLLAHGRTVEMKHFDAIADAGHHIEWALERLICTALAWPI